MLNGVPLTRTERATRAGQASAASRTPDERAETARAGAAAAHRPAVLARRIARAWENLTTDEQREVREILRDAGVIPRR
jgi:hypothetical protein